MALSSQVLKVCEGGASPISLAGFNRSYLISFLILVFAEKSPGCSLRLLPLALWPHTPKRSLTPSCQLEITIRSLSTPSLFFSRMGKPVFLSPPWKSRVTVLVAFHWAWFNLLVLFTGQPKSGHEIVLQMWPHKCDLGLPPPSSCWLLSC